MDRRAGADREELLVIELTLPYPVSSNRYWRSFVPKGHSRAIVTLSDEAKAFKQSVGWIVKQAGIREPIAGRVAIEIQLYPKRPLDWAKRAQRNPLAWDDDVQCLDLDNANKVLLDSLKGIAIEDDRWVRKIVAERMEPDGEGRAVIRITPLALPAHPQASLLEACPS
jgi:crossover junction endodeoxyribonuclease RusA